MGSLDFILRRLNNLEQVVLCLSENICSNIKLCLKISSTANPNLVLNQQGNWISQSGGSSNIDSIEDVGNNTYEYYNVKLIGSTRKILILSTGGVIRNTVNDFNFDNTTGTITFSSVIDNFTFINLIYTF